MWLLPSRGRPEQCQAMLAQCVKMGMTTAGLVLISEPDADAYALQRLPDGWYIMVVPDGGMAEKVQHAYSGMGPDYQWIGVLCDDHWPLTPNWDTELISRLNGRNIVSSDDCDQAPKRMEGATVWSRGLVDAIGCMAPPGLHHLFFDDFWERIGFTTGVLQFANDVKVKHQPIQYTGRADQTSEKVKSFYDEDERTFRAWVADENGLTATVNRVMAYIESSGGAVVRPDLSGFHLYLTTPADDGRFDRVYVRALAQTIDKVRAAGGRIEWGEMPYCADLSLARNRILGAFMKGPYTHMLMIDSDIGWNPDDVLRLAMTKLDFVGGAGPKKTYPLRFCIYSRDEEGREVVGEFSEATQTLEVTGIGTGFLMISKAVGERMMQAYPELSFDPGGGQTEHALFDPLITNKTRFADDFAFCMRWRRIGGTVHCMPSIKLKHVGSHTFEGSLLDQMLSLPEDPH